MADCTCPKPFRPTDYDKPPWECTACGGYACEYADKGQTRCSPAICDCFIEQFPESPRDLHPEAFIVVAPSMPPATADDEPPADAHAPEERILRDILTNQPE